MVNGLIKWRRRTTSFLSRRIWVVQMFSTEVFSRNERRQKGQSNWIEETNGLMFWYRTIIAQPLPQAQHSPNNLCVSKQYTQYRLRRGYKWIPNNARNSETCFIFSRSKEWFSVVIIITALFYCVTLHHKKVNSSSSENNSRSIHMHEYMEYFTEIIVPLN